MNRYQSPYGVYPQQPYVSVQPPQWADPMKLEQKELRRAASRLSFAALAGLPLQYIFINVAAIILMLCGVNLLAPTGNTVGGLPATAYYLVASMLSYFSIVLPYALFLAVGRRRLRDTVLVEKTGALNGILLVLAGVFVCMVMNIPANLISVLLESLGLNGAANTESFTVTTLPELLTMLLSVVLIAPVTEEFAYRGVATAVMRRWGDWTAILFSGLLFGMAHYSFQGLPVVLVGGFVMAFLYVRTRNIWISIAVHFMNNLIAVLPIAVNYLFGAEASTAVNVVSFYAVILVGIAALAILCVLHASGRPVFRTPVQRGLPVRNKALQLVCNPGFIVYFIVFIAMSVVSLYAA